LAGNDCRRAQFAPIQNVGQTPVLMQFRESHQIKHLGGMGNDFSLAWQEKQGLTLVGNPGWHEMIAAARNLLQFKTWDRPLFQNVGQTPVLRQFREFREIKHLGGMNADFSVAWQEKQGLTLVGRK
jgi:hypothetical protein